MRTYEKRKDPDQVPPSRVGIGVGARRRACTAVPRQDDQGHRRTDHRAQREKDRQRCEPKMLRLRDGLEEERAVDRHAASHARAHAKAHHTHEAKRRCEAQRGAQHRGHHKRAQKHVQPTIQVCTRAPHDAPQRHACKQRRRREADGAIGDRPLVLDARQRDGDPLDPHLGSGHARTLSAAHPIPLRTSRRHWYTPMPSRARVAWSERGGRMVGGCARDFSCRLVCFLRR